MTDTLSSRPDTVPAGPARTPGPPQPQVPERRRRPLEPRAAGGQRAVPGARQLRRQLELAVLLWPRPCCTCGTSAPPAGRTRSTPRRPRRGRKIGGLFFGSSDAANAITVDKPPASLWVMVLSVRIFGLSSWSVLVPQALMGVGTVGLLYLAVRRAAARHGRRRPGPPRGASRRCGHGADTGGRADVPVQQPRRPAGAFDDRGRLRRVALHPGRAPALVAARRGAAGLRVPHQEAAGPAGRPRFRPGIPARGAGHGRQTDPSPALRRRGDGCRGRVVAGRRRAHCPRRTALTSAARRTTPSWS